MVQTLAPKSANHPFYESSLPRRARSRKDLLDSHGFHMLPKLTAEDAVSVPQQVPRDLLKGEGFPWLLRGPLGCGMCGDVEMHNAPAVMGKYQEDIQDLEPDRRHGEEVDRYRPIPWS